MPHAADQHHVSLLKNSGGKEDVMDRRELEPERCLTPGSAAKERHSAMVCSDFSIDPVTKLKVCYH